MGNAEVGTFAASFLKAKTKRSVPLLMNEKKTEPQAFFKRTFIPKLIKNNIQQK